jgi:DNA-binding SARP family transcriptional activator/class 3 adenylate cyclase/tetratricopeptide (TPR) repeat protein
MTNLPPGDQTRTVCLHHSGDVVMTRLEIAMLGPPEIRLDGQPMTGLHSDKVRALLFYLAVEADRRPDGHLRPHRRESLAGLLWPDYPERSARTNLSNALSNLRTALGDREADAPYFHVSREAIQFCVQSDCWMDAAAFGNLVECGNWEEAIDLYRGPFLEGFSLSDSPPFEQWTLVVRERLQRQMMAALEGSTVECEERGDCPHAIETARRQLELEPWQESAHRALMRALALSGKRASALAQYEACTRVLEEELDVAPSVETRELYEDIRDGKVVLRKKTPRPQPDQVTPFSPTPATAPALTSPAPASPAPASPAGERRWVTALHAEVNQVAALLDELGPEDWIRTMARALDVVEDEIHRYGGEVLERREDGVVALFGVPSAHEDDPERAVLTALGIQERMQDAPELRIGVDTGEVLVTHAGDRRQVVGRALTLARRANVAADPGAVFVGENAYRLLRRLFRWGERAEDVSRGMHHPLARKMDVGKGRGIPGLSSPLVGRDEEMRALLEAIARLRSGIGSIVTLVGEAGIGKSRLVAELRKQVTAAHHIPRFAPQWIEGRCLSYGGSIPYLLWLDVLRGLLGVTRDASPDTVRDALRDRVCALCPDRHDDVYPYLARLMSLPLEDRYGAVRDLRGESLKAEVFSALETLLARAAEQQPLVVVCEDPHWADATSLALLERLLPLTDRLPVLLLCAFRPQKEHGCWRIRETSARDYGHRHVDLQLKPLSMQESAALVGHLLRAQDLPQELSDRILNHAEGNPFYVEEILRSLIDGGVIAQDEVSAHWRATQDVRDIALPDTLHGLLAARIDRLPPDARRALQLASIIGRIFAHPVLFAVAPSSPDALDAHLLTLQRAQLIRERARVPEREYAFKHVLTQEAAYNSLLRGERRACHRQVAETLERLYAERIEEYLGLLAHHWERAEESERAMDYLVRAGDQARVAYANEEAIDYYQRALALLEDAPLGEARKEWRLAALKGLGTTYFGVGRVSEAEEPLLKAISLGKALALPSQDLIRLCSWLGDVLWWEARYDDLMAVAEESLALLGEDSESLEAALANQLGAMAYAAKGDGDKALEFIGRTASFIQRLPYVEELRPAYDWIILTEYGWGKDVEEAMRWVHILEEKATPHHDLRALGEAHYEAGAILSATGDLHGALPWSRKGLELYTRIGDAKQKSWPLQDLGRNHMALGDLQRAREYAHTYLRNAKEVGDKRDMALAYQNMGQILLCQGNLRKAAQAVQQATSLYREIGLWGAEVIANVLLGQVCLAQEDRRKAREHFQDAIAAFPRCTSLCQRPQQFALAVGGLEEAYHASQAFRASCRRLREGHAEAGDWPLAQWYLEPAELEMHGRVLLHEVFVADLSPGWTWEDPFGDCSFTLGTGLEIHAANGRDLWHTNFSAPRILRAPVGDLAIQTVCGPVSDEQPTIGGLLLWMDRRNYLRLDHGVFGKRDISLMGCVDNDDVVIGRGRLYGDSDRVHLCLERVGDRVNAYCSADDKQWYTVGQVTFPVDDPVLVGVHAIGNIDRTVYPGAYPDGTAIRFESFQMWTKAAE